MFEFPKFRSDGPTSFPLRLSASVGSQSRIDRCCRACFERIGLASSCLPRGGQGKILSLFLDAVEWSLEFLFLFFFNIKSGEIRR